MNLEQIDTSTTAGKAEVMRLAAEGRRVAILVRGDENSGWTASINQSWDWKRIDYAIISEPVLDRPARVGGRDFPAGSLIQQVIGRAHADYDRYHHKRDPRDVASDPDGLLLVAADEPLRAARRRDSVGPEHVWFTVIDGRTDAGPFHHDFTAACRAQNYGGEVVKYIRADLAGEGK